MDASFRQMIADEIYQHIMERKDDIVQAVLSKFCDVYLEYMKMSDVINVFAARNKIDVFFHEYKTITERNLQIKACELFGKIIKIYIQKEVTVEELIERYLLKYNEDITVVSIYSFYVSEDVDFALLKLRNANLCCSHGIRYGKNKFLPGELLENDMMLNENDIVYKWGATTGRTSGKYHGVLCTRKQENGNYDIETYIVEGLDGPFSDEGDSGSLICIKPDSIVYTNHMAAFILIGELQKYEEIDYVNTHACYRVSIPLMEMRKNKACRYIKQCF
ncbi:unnamed protein product [Mytilus coruscus]|uniref:Uncharacterized protein n=1 Tax=Mytilus coruscus TaxID=42192 RepID=A0A6J8D4C9_MYTCO|nr:unnamed protein product [Mytilus coruscus]